MSEKHVSNIYMPLNATPSYSRRLIRLASPQPLSPVVIPAPWPPCDTFHMRGSRQVKVVSVRGLQDHHGRQRLWAKVPHFRLRLHAWMRLG